MSLTQCRSVVLLALVGCLSSAIAGDHNPNTDWLKDARVGVFMHLLPSDTQGLERLWTQRMGSRIKGQLPTSPHCT